MFLSPRAPGPRHTSLIGSLASFLYQYLLWTFDWAYNALFLIYVVLFSLSLCTLTLVLAGVDRTQARASISERFPVRTATSFSFAVGGLLLFKCLGEIVPSVGSNVMPAMATGYYTMVDQALDLGSAVPGLCLAGQTTFQGYGVGAAMMSGIFAAEALAPTVG